MDWTSLANRLAEGERIWRSFQDGANAAARIANAEREAAALQSQLDAFPPQIEQAKATLVSIQKQGEKSLADAATSAASQQRDFDALHQKRIVEAQAELNGWNGKILAQSQVFDQEYAHYQEVITGLKAQVEQIQEQIHSLQGIKDTMKAQLQSV